VPGIKKRKEQKIRKKGLYQEGNNKLLMALLLFFLFRLAKHLIKKKEG
jgi:hypothetical protein